MVTRNEGVLCLLKVTDGRFRKLAGVRRAETRLQDKKDVQALIRPDICQKKICKTIAYGADVVYVVDDPGYKIIWQNHAKAFCL